MFVHMTNQIDGTVELKEDRAVLRVVEPILALSPLRLWLLRRRRQLQYSSETILPAALGSIVCVYYEYLFTVVFFRFRRSTRQICRLCPCRCSKSRSRRLIMVSTINIIVILIVAIETTIFMTVISCPHLCRCLPSGPVAGAGG